VLNVVQHRRGTFGFDCAVCLCDEAIEKQPDMNPELPDMKTKHSNKQISHFQVFDIRVTRMEAVVL
jgi:hypothetical protein